MSKASKPPTRKADAEQLGSLEHLTQQQAAWLVGQSTSWLRNRSHQFARNPDGTYSARALLQSLRTDFVAVELSDDLLEPLIQACDDRVMCGSSAIHAIVELLERIERGHGAAGLAAVGAAFLNSCREEAQACGRAKELTADDLRAQCDIEISHLESLNACHHLQANIKCESCGRLRRGRKWVESNVEASAVGLCPECE